MKNNLIFVMCFFISNLYSQNLRHSVPVNFGVGFTVGTTTNIVTKSNIHSIILPTVVGYGKVYHDSMKFHDGNPKDLLHQFIGGVIGTVSVQLIRKKLRKHKRK